jgi:3-oxoacyl-[acyl-carrier protein] reductase
MSEKLSGLTAIVTGSSAGIGAAIAKRFASEGANVVTNSRSRERAERVAQEIRDAGDSAVAIESDVTDYAEMESLVEAAVAEFGSLDVMVNNAGVTEIAPAEEFHPDEWRRVVDVDLTGVFFGAQLAGRQMIEQGTGGSILNISSMLGEQGLQKRAPYCAAKAGVNNLTRTLAVEWAEHGIHVNALAPGFVRTEITAQTQSSADYTDDDIENRTPFGRFGTLEEMTESALFLVGGDNFVTGEILRADGGWTPYAWGSHGE